MNSIMTKRGFLNLTLCLLTVFLIASCSSSPSRDIATEEASQDDVARIQKGETPYNPTSNRLIRNNQY